MVVLTGAGVSAASGVPTFRGPDGYWTVGSEVYTPERLATRATFEQEPERVWAWYLWRLGTCRAATPSAAHMALVTLEELLGDRFLLITQNVDGLHQRAGSSPQRTYPIHGHLERMRCAAGGHGQLRPVPPGLPAKERDEPLTADERHVVTCPRCGGWLRPHGRAGRCGTPRRQPGPESLRRARRAAAWRRRAACPGHTEALSAIVARACSGPQASRYS